MRPAFRPLPSPMSRLLVTALTFMTLLNVASAAAPAAVSRRALLTADLAPARSVAHVEIKEVTLPPLLAAGRHLHPCPVVGVITAGAIRFQLEGGPVLHLRAGDAFHEPANTRGLHFDNELETPTTFVACYLLGPDEHELIRPLPQ